MWQHKVTRLKRLVTKITDKVSPRARAQRVAFAILRKRFYDDFWQQSVASIDADIEALGNDWFLVRKGNNCTFIHGERVMLDTAVSLELAGDKSLVYRLLSEDGFPVPQSQLFTLESIEKAYLFQQQVQQQTKGDVVVKPMDSWAGQGVTVNIRTPEALKQAAIHASQYSHQLLIENHILGDSYRLLFLNGEFIDAVRRDPPCIIADGKHTIKQLVSLENTARENAQTMTALSPLQIDADCKRTLKELSLSLHDVPSAGKKITIKKVVNQNTKNENHVVRDQVHPDVIEMGRQVSTLYRIELAGLDLITTDISKPLSETGGVINEINTTPGLHHHSLVSDEDAILPVGGLVLDYILKNHPINR